MYVNDNNLTNFDSFGVEHSPKEIKIFMGNKNIITNIYRVQAYNSMCEYFCIGSIDFVNDYEKNDKIILKYFQ